jgi:hypothetical protein
MHTYTHISYDHIMLGYATVRLATCAAGILVCYNASMHVVFGMRQHAAAALFPCTAGAAGRQGCCSWALPGLQLGALHC